MNPSIFLHISITSIYTNQWKGKHPMRLGLVTNQTSHISWFLGYGEETKGYNLFDTSTHKNFIEISVQFEEDIIQDFELAPGEFSSPQHHDDVSDDSLYDNYDN